MAEIINNKSNTYKIYQLLEYFNVKHNFDNVLVQPIQNKNEVWIVNKEYVEFNVIRISIQTLDETFNDRNRIDSYLSAISKTIKNDVNFLDLHISKEEVSINEIYETVCIDSDFYSGKDLEYCFPLLKNVVHEVNDVENELNSKINSINENIKSRFANRRKMVKQKFNINPTTIIIALCILNFIAYVFLQTKYDSISSYIALGADYKMFTLGISEYWRLITYSFVHSSLIHLICNMYSLYIVGNYINRKYGTFKYLLILFLSIIVGGLAHGILTDNQILLGMSGGIYGLFTIYCVDAIKHGAWQNKSFVFILLLNVALNFMSTISWQTHIGGAVVGFIFYYIFENEKPDIKLIVLLTVLVLVLTFKYLSLNSITPLYIGTDNEVTRIYLENGFTRYSKILSDKLYNYYINH